MAVNVGQPPADMYSNIQCFQYDHITPNIIGWDETKTLQIILNAIPRASLLLNMEHENVPCIFRNTSLIKHRTHEMVAISNACWIYSREIYQKFPLKLHVHAFLLGIIMNNDVQHWPLLCDISFCGQNKITMSNYSAVIIVQ